METTEEAKVEGSLRERATAALAAFEADQRARAERRTKNAFKDSLTELVKKANGLGIYPKLGDVQGEPGMVPWLVAEGLTFQVRGPHSWLQVRGSDCPICEQETWNDAMSLIDLGDVLPRMGRPFPHRDCKPVKRGIEWPEQPEPPKPYQASPAEVALLKAAADFVDERVLFLREAAE